MPTRILAAPNAEEPPDSPLSTEELAELERQGFIECYDDDEGTRRIRITEAGLLAARDIMATMPRPR